MRLAILALAMTIGCAKTTESISQERLAELPRLPSPRAGTYARVHDSPKDPVVAYLMNGHRWEAYLSGAAAGLALNASAGSGGFTRREVRDRAWQAGYPYPVVSLGVWPTVEQGAPPRDVKAWLEAQPVSRDIGLVRARGGGKDLWVGLAGEPMIDLGVIPREMELGQQVTLPQRDSTKWWIADGNGVLRTGNLDEALTMRLTVPGEWVFYVADDTGELARFPVYVDEETPRFGVLPVLNHTVASDEQAQARANQLVDIVRDAYGVSPVQADPLLANAALLLKDNKADEKGVLAGLSVDPQAAIVWRCSAVSVEDCVDQVVWDPRYRRGFVTRSEWMGGIAATWTPQKVELVGVMAPAQ